jgi:NAD(P)-dependent dehydrogenase (short-subunit alcohol dehydrogenase family)
MSTFFIVGGSSGIGREISKKLSGNGHEVYSSYFKNAVKSDDPALKYHYLNVLDEKYEIDFLPEVIDGLVYCPGSINLKPFHRITPDQFLGDYNLQLVGAVKTIQAVLPRLKKSENASVVLFSTVAVAQGFNFHSLVSASKGAVEGLVRSLAAELAPGIRVNCIAPSLTDTPLASALLNTEAKAEANAQRHPLKRIGSPGDIASAAEFLLSGDSSWITGQVLHVDGGISAIKS